MNISFIGKNINEGFGNGNSSFRDYEYVIGPDGTVYDTKQIIGLVNVACDLLIDITQGTIAEFLVALPIIYTFQVDTMATDTEYIYINPGFVLKLLDDCDRSPAGIAFVILHEVYHNVFMHHAREAADPKRFSDHDKANAAQDYEINWVIEHSFPDMRSDVEWDHDDPDDSPFEEDGVTRKQIMGGVTKACNGLIDPKYANMVWEDIYDKLDADSAAIAKSDKDEPEINEITMSDDFNAGYKDGWNDAIRELRAKGLVESVKYLGNFLDEVCGVLNESSNRANDYDAGYSTGYEMAMKAYDMIMMGGGAGPQPPLPPVIDRLNPIDGLDTMSPKNVPPSTGGESSSVPSDPNVPINIKGSGNGSNAKQGPQQQSSQSQGNSQNSQSSGGGSSQNQGNSQGGNGQGGQQDNNGPQGTDSQGGAGQGGQQDNNGPQGTDSQGGNGQGRQQDNPYGPDGVPGGAQDNPYGPDGVPGGKRTTSQELQDQARKSGKTSINVGICDGNFSGKDDAAAGQHIISKDQGNTIRKQAGIKDGNDDPRFAGKAKNPFKDPKAITHKIAKIGQQPGQGRGPAGHIIDQINKVFSPKIDWKEEMRNRLDACFSSLQDAGWSKKALSYDAYSRFDDWEGNSLENLIIMIDTSGSILEDDYLNQVITEMMAIGEEVNPACIDLVLFCDGVYYHHKFEDRYKPGAIKSEFEHNLHSGGTTYMECFKYIKTEYINKGEEFACCIIFTDTDVCHSRLPKKSDLDWDPGSAHDDDAKLLWFVLNDNPSYDLNLPYGGKIEMTHDDFLKSLNESVKPNIVKIPRRYIMKKTQNINEAGYFKSIDKMKAQAHADERPTVEMPADAASTGSEEVPVAPVRKKKQYDPLRRRAELIRALRAGGSLEEFKDSIRKWIKTHTNIDPDGYTGWYPNKTYDVEITDELYININNGKDLILTGDDLGSVESFISFNKLSGNLTVGGNRYLTQLPGCFLGAKVAKDFICINMPSLKTLMGAPLKVGGNYILTGCKNLETLDGAPMSTDDFSGVFMSDTRFSNEDFYETIENGGLMKDSDYVLATDAVRESAKTRKNVEAIVESRIALGKKYASTYSINEAFSSRILSRLAKNPNNRAALDTMKTMKVFWSEIPDEIITPVYGSVTKLIQARRVVNKDTSKFGITICCDNNDNISVIGTGDNQGDWRGNTWLYLNSKVLPLIKKRAQLVYTANSKYKNETDVAAAQKELNALGINWEKSDIQKLSEPNDKNDLKFPHLYLIPEYCAKSYVIKGMDDNKSVASKDPEFARNFSYRSQEARREELAGKRREANAGRLILPKTRTIDAWDEEGNPIRKEIPYSVHSRENDPAVKKYFNDLIDEDIIRKARQAHGSNVALEGFLNNMLESVNNAKREVRKALIKGVTDGIVPEDEFDLLYTRFVLSTYQKFKLKVEEEIEKAAQKSASGKSYLRRLSGTSAEGDEEVDMKNIRGREFDSSYKASDIIKKPYYSYSSYDNGYWYRLYIATVKTFAQILSKINAARRGRPEELTAYAEKIRLRMLGSNYDDEFRNM